MGGSIANLFSEEDMTQFFGVVLECVLSSSWRASWGGVPGPLELRPGVCSAVRSGVLPVGMRRVGSVVSFYFFASGGDEVCSNVLVCRLCILIQHFATLEVEFGLCCSVAHFVFVI